MQNYKVKIDERLNQVFNAMYIDIKPPSFVLKELLDMLDSGYADAAYILFRYYSGEGFTPDRKDYHDLLDMDKATAYLKIAQDMGTPLAILGGNRHSNIQLNQEFFEFKLTNPIVDNQTICKTQEWLDLYNNACYLAFRSAENIATQTQNVLYCYTIGNSYAWQDAPTYLNIDETEMPLEEKIFFRDKAVRFLTVAADAGIEYAANNISNLFNPQSTLCVIPNKTQMLSIAQKYVKQFPNLLACEADIASKLAEDGKCDFQQVFDMYLTAYNNGHRLSAGNLAYILNPQMPDRHPIEKNIPLSLSYYKILCDTPFAKKCSQAFLRGESYVIPQNSSDPDYIGKYYYWQYSDLLKYYEKYDEAFEMITAYCAISDNYSGLGSLALYYFEGLSVEQNYNLAFKLLVSYLEKQDWLSDQYHVLTQDQCEIMFAYADIVAFGRADFKADVHRGAKIFVMLSEHYPKASESLKNFKKNIFGRYKRIYPLDI